MKRFSQRGFTAIEAVLAVAILSGVGLLISQVFTRANRMAANSSLTEKAVALGESVLEHYNAYAARGYADLSSYNQTLDDPRLFLRTNDDQGFGGLRLTTRAVPDEEHSRTLVTVQISWGGGLFPPTVTFSKVYPHWMGGPENAEPSHAL